jgi:hypothetical protein
VLIVFLIEELDAVDVYIHASFNDKVLTMIAYKPGSNNLYQLLLRSWIVAPWGINPLPTFGYRTGMWASNSLKYTVVVPSAAVPRSSPPTTASIKP